jgi:hypothetical protein
MHENNPQKVDPDLQDISDIVNKHTTDGKVKTNPHSGKVEITLFSEKELGSIVKELAETEHSFTVENGFEVPIKVRVSGKINPDI